MSTQKLDNTTGASSTTTTCECRMPPSSQHEKANPLHGLHIFPFFFLQLAKFIVAGTRTLSTEFKPNVTVGHITWKKGLQKKKKHATYDRALTQQNHTLSTVHCSQINKLFTPLLNMKERKKNYYNLARA